MAPEEERSVDSGQERSPSVLLAPWVDARKLPLVVFALIVVILTPLAWPNYDADSPSALLLSTAGPVIAAWLSVRVILRRSWADYLGGGVLLALALLEHTVYLHGWR